MSKQRNALERVVFFCVVVTHDVGIDYRATAQFVCPGIQFDITTISLIIANQDDGKTLIHIVGEYSIPGNRSISSSVLDFLCFRSSVCHRLGPLPRSTSALHSEGIEYTKKQICFFCNIVLNNLKHLKYSPCSERWGWGVNKKM